MISETIGFSGNIAAEGGFKLRRGVRVRVRGFVCEDWIRIRRSEIWRDMGVFGPLDFFGAN